jgi:hypothetical protein
MLQGRPKLLHQADSALCSKDRVFPRNFFDLGDSLA